MSTVIAVSGKGGVGKTTFAALTVKFLASSGLKPVLAVDADPNSNLHTVLGVELRSTIGAVREEMTEKVQKGELPAGMSKQDILELQIEQSLVEAEDFDLISMGRQEGPGCYCAINNVLRVFLDRLTGQYRYVVIDNEAGMEHLSRRTTRKVDFMFIISDPSVRGLKTAAAIKKLATEMKISVGRFYLVVSRVRGEPGAGLLGHAEETGLELAGWVPHDPALAELDNLGRPLTELAGDSPAVRAVRTIMEGTVLLARQRE